MMNTIVNEELVSFKELEKKIYSYVCELAREITQQMLESYDEKLAKSRDKKVYRGKGKRKTSIKTVYGEVEYSRNVYRTETEDGQAAHIFLLDQAMHMDKIGLISTNLAEKIAFTVITLRMKHHRMRWSVNGANNLAKALYRKENRELAETIDRYTDGLVFTMQMQEIIETLSAAKAPKKDGKGNPYADRFNHHMPLFEAMQTASRKAFKRAFGY